MASSSSIFVREMFAEFYRDTSFTILSQSSVEKREFGFALFDGRMLRHKSFGDDAELRAFLRSCVPSDAYFSCAYYDDPEAEMDKKGWQGADLVFDIDADHIPTSCSKIHDEWTCSDCGFTGKGLTPEGCPACSGQRFEVKTWPCEECLSSAKAESVKLLDMLTRDFGFSDKDIHVFFSGHRGYHVHVESQTARSLDASARKEIVDYVCGFGLDVSSNRLGKRNAHNIGLPVSPRLDDSGWRGRIAKSMYDFVLGAKEEDYKSFGLNKKIADSIMQNRDSILRGWNSVGPYHSVKGVGLETWRRIVKFCIESLSAKVDTVVTTDIHRLIRLTGSLHGKTGLRKVEFPVSNIEVFDPFISGVALKRGAATVLISDAPEFRLGDSTFGPYKNQRIELPTAAAILLICRGRAEVAECNV